MANHQFYVDESGNAGMNYLDAGQPFHVAGGFLVSHDRLSSVESVVQSFLNDGQGEIKGTRLMRSAAGQRRAIALLEQLGAAGAVPFFIIMDRAFSIAGKVVDVFLDPMHQPNVDWLPTSDIPQRQAITEMLSARVSSRTLGAFVAAYKHPTHDGFKAVLETLVADLNDLGEARLAHGFQGAIEHLDVIVADETYDDEDTKHRQWAALNVPAFKHLIGKVDRFMDAVPTRFDIIHDQTHEFAEPLARTVEFFRIPDAPHVDVPLVGGRSVRGIFRNVDQFSTADSKETPALQAADVLASSVARVARTGVTDRNWSKHIQRLAELTLPALFYDEDTESEPLNAGFYGPEKVWMDLMVNMMRHFRGPT